MTNKVNVRMKCHRLIRITIRSIRQEFTPLGKTMPAGVTPLTLFRRLTIFTSVT